MSGGCPAASCTSSQASEDVSEERAASSVHLAESYCDDDDNDDDIGHFM